MELIINKLKKYFKDVKAVDDVSLNLTKGVWGLLGANGAGKTTLIRMLAGVSTPDSGQIYYDGIDIGILKEKYRDKLGYLPQHFGYYPHFNVIDYLEYISSLKGLSKKESKLKIDELLYNLRLEEVRKKKISKLSGGMKRRVGIAQSLLNEPDILILDEPTTGLDPGERVRFRKMITEYVQNRIVLISTHIVSDVENIAEKNAIMKNGKIIKVGTTEELIIDMKGKVWEMKIPTKNLNVYEKSLKVVNIRNEENGEVTLRYISENETMENAREVYPRLEDLYLYLFDEKRDIDD